MGLVNFVTGLLSVECDGRRRMCQVRKEAKARHEKKKKRMREIEREREETYTNPSEANKLTVTFENNSSRSLCVSSNSVHLTPVSPKLVP